MSSDHVWQDLESLIDEQLCLQVRMQFAHHHAFMQAHGLSDCAQVMDIGVGNGAFLSRLAQAHPEKSFIGVDDKPHMVAKANEAAAQNMQVVCGDVVQPESIPHIRTVNGVLMRYVLLHLPDASLVLQRLFDTLQPGTRLWIIDLDLEHYECRPTHPAFDLMKGLVQQFCAAHGKDCNVGSKLCTLLQQAGFQDVQQAIEPLNTDTTDITQLQQFLRNEVTAYHVALHDVLTEEQLQHVMDFIDALPRSGTFLNYGVTMVTAVK